MKIPIFVSSPSDLSRSQNLTRERIIKQLERLNLEPRALGRTDYPTEYPLREIYVLAKHCSGGIILGFEQIRVTSGIIKAGTNREKSITKESAISIPTAWNQLEAGVLFGLHKPLLIFREGNVSGGVFDNGVTDIFVHALPMEIWKKSDVSSMNEVFLKWHSKVRENYYNE